QPLAPLSRRARAEVRVQDLVQLLPVSFIQGPRAEARIGAQVRALDRAAEARPELRAGAAEREVAVGGGDHAPDAADHTVAAVGALRLPAAEQVVRDLARLRPH